MEGSECFLAFSRSHQPAVNQFLTHYFARHSHGQTRQLWRAMAYSCLLPGKRFRPLLVLAGAALGEKPALPIKEACAIEMIHVYSLIHDDLPCIDNDDTRRGAPSNHKMFGEATALLAGTSLYAEALGLIAQGNGSTEQALRCLKEITSATGARGLMGGEFIDTTGFGTEPAKSIITEMSYLKTGRLLEAALLIGAYLGSVNHRHYPALRRYGRSLGLLFQLTDDLLDRMDTAESLEPIGPRQYSLTDIYGPKECEELADSLYLNCLESLAGFSQAAAPLRSAAAFVRTRQH